MAENKRGNIQCEKQQKTYTFPGYKGMVEPTKTNWSACSELMTLMMTQNRMVTQTWQTKHEIRHVNWRVTEQVISKSDECEVQGRFEIASTITP